MMQKKYKVVAWAISIALVVGLCPGLAFAAQAQPGKEGGSLAVGSTAVSATSDDDSDGQNDTTTGSTTGFQTIDGKKYYIDANGNKLTGWQSIEGSRYYFGNDGAMRTGLVKIGKNRYFFDQKTGHMAGMGFYKNWAIAYDGKCYKVPKKTANKTKCANDMAKLIVKCVGPKKYWKQFGSSWQLYQVRRATYYVWVLAWKCKYTTKGTDYCTPYGVFYAKKFSCAGTAAAMKLVLGKMGYKCKHVNKNKWTHQWVTLKMDDKTGWCDAYPMGGGAGYGKHPVTKSK